MDAPPDWRPSEAATVCQFRSVGSGRRTSGLLAVNKHSYHASIYEDSLVTGIHSSFDCLGHCQWAGQHQISQYAENLAYLVTEQKSNCE